MKEQPTSNKMCMRRKKKRCLCSAKLHITGHNNNSKVCQCVRTVSQSLCVSYFPQAGKACGLGQTLHYEKTDWTGNVKLTKHKSDTNTYISTL